MNVYAKMICRLFGHKPILIRKQSFGIHNRDDDIQLHFYCTRCRSVEILSYLNNINGKYELKSEGIVKCKSTQK